MHRIVRSQVVKESSMILSQKLLVNKIMQSLFWDTFTYCRILAEKQDFSGFGHDKQAVLSVITTALMQSHLQKTKSSFAALQALVYQLGHVNLVTFSSSKGICCLPKTHQMEGWNNYILFTWKDRKWNYHLTYIWNYDSATCSVSVWSLS